MVIALIPDGANAAITFSPGIRKKSASFEPGRMARATLPSAALVNERLSG